MNPTSCVHTPRCTGPRGACPWHARFPCYQVRLAHMAQHCRTEEFAKGLGRLVATGLVPTEAEASLDAYMAG